MLCSEGGGYLSKKAFASSRSIHPRSTGSMADKSVVQVVGMASVVAIRRDER